MSPTQDEQFGFTCGIKKFNGSCFFLFLIIKLTDKKFLLSFVFSVLVLFFQRGVAIGVAGSGGWSWDVILEEDEEFIGNLFKEMVGFD